MFFKLIKNEQGASLVGAMVVMVALAATAAGVVSLSGTDTRSYTNNMQKSQAFAVSNAGLQYGLDRLNNGIDCDATKTISSGQSFTTTCDPNSSTITSVGTVGESKSTQTINADFAKNCVDLIVSGAEINGANVENIQLVKTCNKQAIVSKAYFSWNVSECALGTQCDGSNAVDDVDDDSVGDENNEVVYEDVGSPPNNKFWICHVPPGNPENRHSIAVNINGWIHGHSMGQNTHNMDYLGPCIISGTPDDDEEEVEDEGCAEDQIEIDGECYDQVVTCAETQESYEILEECVESDGGLQVIGVELAETAIYASGSVPFNYSPAVSTGNEVDVADSVMSNNGVYQMNLTYDSDLANYLGMWLSVTVEFADGSQLTGVVKLGNEPNPDAANEVAQAQAQEEAVEEEDEEVDASR
ncbi:MAG: hypothetical protein H7A33_03935 [Deltaproteobacteria bacterium]|nr:hypothetical protein [Deltaproteobacteria bacterium]